MKTVCALLVLFIALSALACSETPQCNFPEAGGDKANAGCLVVRQGRLLVTEDMQGRFSVPGGRSSGGEVAQCTAERETWEETGVEVVAGALVKRFANGFHLYACEAMENQVFDGSARPARAETRAVYWLSVDEFEGRNWRFPGQLPLMKNQILKTTGSLAEE